MNMLMARVIGKQAEQIKDEVQRKDMKARLEKFYSKSQQALNGAADNAIDWRTNQVTPINLCVMQKYFWQEFEGICETRWSRSRRDAEKNVFAAQDKKEALTKKIDAIGGTVPDFQMFMKGFVDDTVSGKSIYEESKVVEGTQKADLMEEMLENGLKARNKYVKKLTLDVKGLFTQSVDMVEGALMKKISSAS